MPGYDLSINIKSASDTGAVRSVDDLLGRLQRTAGELNQRLSSVSQGGGQAERVLNSMSGEARALNDRLLAVSQSAQQTAGNLETVGDAGQQAAEGLQQASGSSSEAGSSAQKAGKNAQDSAMGWVAVAAKLHTAKIAYQWVTEHAEKAYAAVRRGAELELQSIQFERLAASIGTTADALLNDMQRATDGMVSQAQLIASANDLISLKLAKSHDEAVRLATVSGQLGWNLQTLGMVFNNRSWLRLDTLGLAMEDVRAKMEALKAAGMDTDQAFRFAVIEAGEEKVKLLGSTSDTTYGKILRLEAAWANLGDELKQEIVANIDTEDIDEAVDNIVTLTGKVTTLVTWIEKIASISPPAWPNWFAELLTAGAGVVTDPENQGMSERERAAWAEARRQAEGATVAQEQRNANLERNANLWRTQSEQERAAYYRAVREAAAADQVLMQQQAAWRAQQSQQFEEETEAVWNYHAALRAVVQSDREMTYTTEAAVEAGKKNAENYTEQAIRARELEELKQQLLVSDREFTYTTPQNVRAGQERAAAMAEQMAAADELEAAMRKLEETTAGYFDTIRKGGELDYDEIFYNAARAAGASAREIADFMVAQGQWTQLQADAKVAAAELGTQVEILGSTWRQEGLTADQAAIAMQYLTTGVYDNAEAAIRAAKYGSVLAGTLDTEVSPSLRTGRDAAKEYGGALGGIPEDVTTTVETPGLPEATTRARDHDTAVRQIPEGVTTEIETPGLPEATTNAIDYYTELGFIPDFVETEVRTPGMSSAIEDASTLDGYLRGIPAEVTSTIRVVTFASGGAYDPGLGTYVPPSSGGGNPSTPPGVAGSFASGTGGWLEIPGPRGKSHLIEVHGGEGLNVNPDGIPAGGGDHNEYHITLIIDGRRSDLPAGSDDAEPFLAAARRLGVPV